MFQQIDTVVAFAMIMLLLSLVITAVVQLVVSVLGLRGRNLLWALTQLLKEADPSVKAKAKELARGIVAHPVLATSTNRVLWLIDRLRGDRPPLFNNGKRPPTAIRDKEIVLVLKSLLPTHTADDLAKVEAGVKEWFETVMDAASEKFKLWSRWITVAGAVVLGFGFQVDSMEIFHRLSRDPAARTAVLEQVDEAKLRDLYTAAVPELSASSQSEDARERLKKAGDALDSVLDEVYKTRVVDLRWVGDGNRGRAGGKLLTVLLLSLGAPFWYGTLKNLVGLRSVVARKMAEKKEGSAPG